MIPSHIEVIRAAAAEQRGFASQVVSPAKMRIRFEETAANLERVAVHLERLQRAALDVCDWHEKQASVHCTIEPLRKALT